ncbi:hypothetical protein BH18ACI4_BH18ACI4_12730 [soil metagenome]
MNPDRLQQIKNLFHLALERESAERAAFLDAECGADYSMRRAVESLLAHHEQAENFIESPATLIASGIFDDEKSELEIGQTIGHYEVLELLGAGGMGEVYLAQDTSLGRRVALKLLPALYTQDADRVRRFAQEARTASALNHPNIITIFEIGHTDSSHFIVTEYIEGATLRSHLATTRIKAHEALDIAVQVASALVAAHAKGVVHRDIKPENIMVLNTDYSLHRENSIKVLDFGIAKLTEAGSLGAEEPTRPLINTNHGIALGTVPYMSPEQARAMAVDARSDIWSLGVVLYEMLAGKIPFWGETSEDVRAAILRDAISPLSPFVPQQLRWIVEKALRKDREERYQTAREFLSDLRELQKQEFVSEAQRAHSVLQDDAVSQSVKGERTSLDGSPVSTNEAAARTTSSAEYIVGEIRQHKRGVAIAVTVLLLTIVGFAYGLISLWRRSPPASATSSRSIKITRLTDSGRATAAAISPDGKYVVYALQDEGKQSLWLRQVAPASEREIVSPAAMYIRGLTFSKDGNLVYYTASDRETVFGNGVLYQVPALGGTPRKVMARVSSAITFAPDGSRIAFVRDNQGSGGEAALMIANVDGTEDRVLAQHKGTLFFNNSGPAWSPDGKIIACAAWFHPNGFSNSVVEVSVADGREKPITSYEGWTGPVDRMTWLRDGSGLIVVAAADVTSGSQIWHLAYPSGEARRITNDLNDYGIDSLTLTSDQTTLAVVQQNQTVNFWLMTVTEDASRARQITQGNFVSDGGLSWTPDKKIIFPRRIGDQQDLWIMDQDGTNQRQLTADAPWEAYPMFSPDGRYLVLNSSRALNSDRVNLSHIWRFDADGTNPKQLTSGKDEDFCPVFTPDGQWVIFSSYRSGKQAIWKVSIYGGDPVQLVQQTSAWPAVSPDGKLFACGYHDDDPNSPFHLAVFPIAGGQPAKLFDITSNTKFGPGLSWTSDGRALLYVDTREGVSNIWSQAIDGGPPKQLTNFKSHLISRFALSPDGRQLVMARGSQTRDVVLIRDFS